MKDIVIFIWMIVFLIVLLLLYRFFLFIKTIKLEKRIDNYALDKEDFNDLAIGEKIELWFNNLSLKLAISLKKNKLFTSYDKDYNTFGIHRDGYYILANKIILAIGLGIISFLIGMLFFFDLVLLITGFGILIGYLLPDLIFRVTRIKNKKRISNDLVKVLSIMNHAFRSGKSIIQAIEVVSLEMDGPLRYEFKKMKMDLKFGLDLDTVFERFYERVPLDDVRYLTTSLIVFNKTGGNIITIFKLIEKNYYTRMELKKELDANTSSAKLVYRLLTFLPIFMVILITVLNPSYFNILFTNLLGILILISIITIYIVYILIIKKLLKIEF